jgi:hypothetical protein
LNLYTITLRCHITGRESDYKVSFPSEEALGQYFAGARDRLIAVSDGWGDFGQWAADLFGYNGFHTLKPHYKTAHWIQVPYDFMEDDLL